MPYLLDTNICIYIIKKKPQSVLDKFTSIQPGEIGISMITVAELQYGARKSANPEKNLPMPAGRRQPLIYIINRMNSGELVIFFRSCD